MGDLYLNEQKLMEELVGIVGMLSHRDGATLKDITELLESLHGPVKQNVVQVGLRSAVSAGILVSKNRRYKVCKQEDILGEESLFDLEELCSDANSEELRDTNFIDDDSVSGSSVYTQTYDYLEEEPSPAASEHYTIEEILSVKTIPSSVSDVTYPNIIGSEGSFIDSKSKKKKNTKKHLIVKLPFSKKNTTVDNDMSEENAADQSERPQRDLSKDVGTQETADAEQNACSDTYGDTNFPSKRSINDVMNVIMKQLSGYNKSNDSEHLEKGKIQKGESKYESRGCNDAMSKAMTEVMTKVNNFDQSDSKKAPVEKSEGVARSLSGTITAVMRRITGGEEPPSTTPIVLDTVSQDISPSCSNYKTPKSLKREKRAKQQNESNDTDDGVRYFTRSRGRSVEKSRTQSPSNSDISSKRAKFS